MSRLYIVTHPAYLIYMQSISYTMPCWMKDKLESRLLGEISITSAMRVTSLLWQKAKKNHEPVDEGETESGKAGLKLNIQKTKIMAFGPITSWQIYGETMETVTDFILGGLQNHCRW